MFDLNGSGRISRSELRDVLRSLGHNPNEDQINLLVAQVWNSSKTPGAKLWPLGFPNRIVDDSNSDSNKFGR